jgi:hypothetical protein
VSAGEQVLVLRALHVVLRSRKNVDPAQLQLAADRPRDMDVHVEADRHLQASLGAHPLNERGWRCSLASLFREPFILGDLAVDFLGVVVIVGHRRVDLGRLQEGVLAAHFLDG